MHIALEYAKSMRDLMNQDEGLFDVGKVRMKQIADEHMEYFQREHMVKMLQQLTGYSDYSHKDVGGKSSAYPAGRTRPAINRFHVYTHDDEGDNITEKTLCTAR